MPRKIFSLSLLIIGFLCMDYGSNPSTLEDSPAETFPERANPALQATDLSGRYVGTLNYPEAGFSGLATLTIDGKRFTLKGNGLNLSGTLEAIQQDRSLAITMRINEVSTTTGSARKKVLALRATISNGRLTITSLPNNSGSFHFSTGLPATTGRDPNALTAANTNTVSTNANANTVTTNANLRPDNRSLNPRTKTRAKAPDTTQSASNPNTNDASGNSNANRAGEPSLYDQLKGEANAVFTTPSSMPFEETTDIELLVSPTKSTAALESELTERGQSGNASTQYSKMMEAQLVGHGFNVAPVGPSIQPVEPGKTTRWKWQIKPKEGGAQRLDLTLSAVLNDGKDRILLQTLHREITVNVKLSQRAAGWLSSLKDMQWLWAVIIVPIGSFAVAWWRRKKKRPNTRKKK